MIEVDLGRGDQQRLHRNPYSPSETKPIAYLAQHPGSKHGSDQVHDPEAEPSSEPARRHGQTADPSPFYLVRSGFNAPVWQHALFRCWIGGHRTEDTDTDAVSVWTALAVLLDDVMSAHRTWIADLVGGVGEMRMRSVADLCAAVVPSLHHELDAMRAGPQALLAQLERVPSRIAALTLPGDLFVMPCGWAGTNRLHLIVVKDTAPDLFVVAVSNTDV